MSKRPRKLRKEEGGTANFHYNPVHVALMDREAHKQGEVLENMLEAERAKKKIRQQKRDDKEVRLQAKKQKTQKKRELEILLGQCKAYIQNHHAHSHVSDAASPFDVQRHEMAQQCELCLHHVSSDDVVVLQKFIGELNEVCSIQQIKSLQSEVRRMWKKLCCRFDEC